MDALQATNEELRSKLTDVQIELQQEKGKVGHTRYLSLIQSQGSSHHNSSPLFSVELGIHY